MSEDSGGHPDLFNPFDTPLRDPRGRKRHKRNALVAEKVAVLVATGSTVEEIVLRIGLSAPTLRKYYFRELEAGTELARQVLVETMWRKALEWNVAAAKFIRDELPKGAQEEFLRKAAVEGERRSQPKGKKEQAQEAAQTAGQDTEWGDLLASRIMN